MRPLNDSSAARRARTDPYTFAGARDARADLYEIRAAVVGVDRCGRGDSGGLADAVFLWDRDGPAS